MRLFIILLFFFTTLFGCDTSTNNRAYQDYIQAKKIYIQAILDNNTKTKISSLKEIIKCGKFLGFNVVKYDNRLEQLTNSIPKKITHKQAIKYIKLLSINPIKVKLSKNMRVRFFTLHRKFYFYKVLDIYNAKIHKTIKHKYGIVQMKIAQNNKHKVRLVLYSKQKFKIRFSSRNDLVIHILNNRLKHANKSVRKMSIIHKYKKNKIIVIDAGHGGKDPGAIGKYHIKEKNIVLPVAKYLKYELNKRGYKVYLTRNSDKFITLKNRTKLANKKKADLFISLHCNIAPHHSEVYGIETYYLSPARSNRAKAVAKLENSAIGNLRTTTQSIVLNFLNKNKIIDSTKLAIDIQKSLIYNLSKKYKIKDGGVRPAPFWVLVGSSMPAILIEMGFLSNKQEAKKLKNKNYQKSFAKDIADGIDNYFRKN